MEEIKQEFLKMYKEYSYRYRDIYPVIYEGIEDLKFEDIETMNEVIIEIEKNKINIEVQISNNDFPRNIFVFDEIDNIEDLKELPFLLTIKILDEDYNFNNFDIDYYLFNESFFGNFRIKNDVAFRFHSKQEFRCFFEELRTSQNIKNF